MGHEYLGMLLAYDHYRAVNLSVFLRDPHCFVHNYVVSHFSPMKRPLF
jgi:hypothetical protein